MGHRYISTPNVSVGRSRSGFYFCSVFFRPQSHLPLPGTKKKTNQNQVKRERCLQSSHASHSHASMKKDQRKRTYEKRPTKEKTTTKNQATRTHERGLQIPSPPPDAASPVLLPGSRRRPPPSPPSLPVPTPPPPSPSLHSPRPRSSSPISSHLRSLQRSPVSRRHHGWPAASSRGPSRRVRPQPPPETLAPPSNCRSSQQDPLQEEHLMRECIPFSSCSSSSSRFDVCVRAVLCRPDSSLLVHNKEGHGPRTCSTCSTSSSRRLGLPALVAVGRPPRVLTCRRQPLEMPPPQRTI